MPFASPTDLDVCHYTMMQTSMRSRCCDGMFSALSVKLRKPLLARLLMAPGKRARNRIHVDQFLRKSVMLPLAEASAGY
jgi:hypothetical protein